MKNKQIDLNNHLFAQLERLGDESLTQEEIKDEVNRSKAMTGISRAIIDNGKLALDVQKAIQENLISGKRVPEMLAIKGDQHG